MEMQNGKRNSQYRQVNYGLRIIASAIIALLLATSSYGQPTNFNAHWIAGGGGVSMIDFMSGSAVTDTFHNNNLVAQNVRIDKGHSNICDSTGKIILMCNGYTIYDSAGNVIMDGDTLVDSQLFVGEFGYSVFAQTSIILPMDSGMYYVIVPNATDSVYNNWYTVPYSYNAYFDQLLLYKVDIDGNNGLPKVMERIVLMDSVRMIRTMMMACKHANGKDWWLVKQMQDSSSYMIGPYPQSANKTGTILISDTGFSAPIFQTYPNSYMPFFEQLGQAMFNCDGSKYAATARGLDKLFLADFDRSTGIFSNPQFLDIPHPYLHNTTTGDSITHGVCFSPNSQFIYVARNANILQYDLLDSDTSTQWYHVAGVDTLAVAWFTNYANIYPGPDNKLYIGNQSIQSQTMSYIDSPSIKGAGCAWRPRGLQFRHTPYYVTSGPPCMPYYDMDLVPCDTSVSLGNGPDNINEIFAEQLGLMIYPNPAHKLLNIRISKPYRDFNFTLIGVDGSIVRRGILSPTINLEYISPGLYLLRVYNSHGSTGQKIVVE